MSFLNCFVVLLQSQNKSSREGSPSGSSSENKGGGINSNIDVYLLFIIII